MDAYCLLGAFMHKKADYLQNFLIGGDIAIMWFYYFVKGKPMTDTSEHIRQIYTFDNLPILRNMDSESVDLIYLDPPFNSGKQWENPIEAGGKKALASFKDTWELSDSHADEAYSLGQQYPPTLPLIESLYDINGGSWKAYLIYMGVRLAEMRRILKPIGSIYYHCDPVMSHGIKLLLDCIFGVGKNNFRNEIIWAYTGPSSPGIKQFPRKHDSIFWYSKTQQWNFNREEMRVPYKDPKQTLRKAMDAGKGIGHDEVEKYRDRGKIIENWWDDIALAVRSPRERTGYPTQKPVALLERIIKASSNKGDLILDPFCGCATTCLAAERLGRQWIGIDISEEAAELVLDRLKKDVELPLTNPEKVVMHLTKMPKRTDLPHRTDNALLKKKLYKEQNGKCIAPCGENGEGREFPIDEFDIDHIIATARGGQNVDENLQLLCHSCNHIKSNKGMEHLIREILQRRTEEDMQKYREKRKKAQG